MYNDANERVEDVEVGGPVGLKDRLRNFFGIGAPLQDDPEPAAPEEPEPVRESPAPYRPLHTTEVAPPMTPRNTTTFRVATVRESSIAITPANSFAHAQKVADRLKEGEPQIVNLDGASSEVAVRLIDFLNGITYALNGAVERISERAYLFTPAGMQINADKPEEPAKSPFDRI